MGSLQRQVAFFFSSVSTCLSARKGLGEFDLTRPVLHMLHDNVFLFVYIVSHVCESKGMSTSSCMFNFLRKKKSGYWSKQQSHSHRKVTRFDMKWCRFLLFSEYWIRPHCNNKQLKTQRNSLVPGLFRPVQTGLISFHRFSFFVSFSGFQYTNMYGLYMHWPPSTFACKCDVHRTFSFYCATNRDYILSQVDI